jgi:hypothetical protein
MERNTMAKHLSEHLRDLSVRAKGVEDAYDAAQKEAHEKLTARREEARRAAIAATERVHEEVKSFQDTVSRNWGTLRAKVAADVQNLKQAVAQQKQTIEVKLAEKNAEILERDAEFAIDYAIACVQQANLAVLDALGARVQAETLQKKTTAA